MIGRIVTTAALDYTQTEPPASLNTILNDLAQYRTASGRNDVEKIVLSKGQVRHLFGRYQKIGTIWGIPLEVR